MEGSEIVHCPVCGTPMNHHADKLLYASEFEGSGTGERLEAFYRCPACGAGDRRALTMDGV